MTRYINKTKLAATGIPEMFWEATMSSRNPESLLDQIEKIHLNLSGMREQGVGVILYGAPLCGKSFWLTYILKLIMSETSYLVRYESLHDIVDSYFDMSGEVSKIDMMANITYPDWLAIDNLCDGGNDGYRIVLNKVLRKRVDANKPTLLAASCARIDDLASEYDIKMCGIIKEHCHHVKLSQTAARFNGEREKVKSKLLFNAK